jgi:hypothetical protein
MTGRDRKTIRLYINNEDWNTSKKDKKGNLFLKLEPFAVPMIDRSA